MGVDDVVVIVAARTRHMFVFQTSCLVCTLNSLWKLAADTPK